MRATTCGTLKTFLAIWEAHDVSVVALGHRDKSIRMLHTGAAQHVDVGPIADDLVALEVASQDAPERGGAKAFGSGRR